MKKLSLMFAVVIAAICSMGCSEESTVMLWHEFSYDQSNLTGDAASYVNSEFLKLQSEYYQKNTTSTEATDALISFCRAIEAGVKSAGYEVAGDDTYAQFSVIDPLYPEVSVSTQRASFTKTRDEVSYTRFSVTLESPKGDTNAIINQLQKLSFYESIAPNIEGDNVVGEYFAEHDVNSDLKSQWVSDLAVLSALNKTSTYEGSESIFTVSLYYSYYSYNEKSGVLVQASCESTPIDSPSLIYHKFTQIDGSYPKEFTFTGHSYTVDAPYFVDYTLNADGTTVSGFNIRRSGSTVTSDDSSIEFEIESSTSVKMTKYNNNTVNVYYTIEKK